MRNITRWLQNRFGKQRELTRYKFRKNYDFAPWPLHIFAPTKGDIEYLKKKFADGVIGKSVSPGGRLRVVIHYDFIWYFDSEHSISFTDIILPDGTEWSPFDV